MESLYQELRCTGQSYANPYGYLFVLIVRGYFSELRKVSSPASENFSHTGDTSVVTGTYL